MVKLKSFLVMSKSYKPRLRSFEEASNQRHIIDEDRFLYKKEGHKPKYRINIIGTGTMGQEHMYVTALLGEAQVHGIYDEEKHSLDIAENEYTRYSSKKLLRYNDLKSACNDPDVDALFICTPNYTHLDVLKVAMESKKPIFIEKPMATTIEDASEIVRLADGYPSFIQIGLQYRYKAQYVETIHEVLERKTIGDLKTISMSEYRPPFLDKVKQWNKFSRYSGGTLIEKCCHYFDLINLFAKSYPKNIYASGGRALNFIDFAYNGENSDIDDHAFVIIEYQNGIKANFTLNMFCPDFSEELILCAEKGRIISSEKYSPKNDGYSSARIQIELGEEGSSRDSMVSYPSEIEKSGHHGATFFEHIELIKKLNGDRSNSATVIEGLWSVVIAGAAQKSIETGSQIDVDDFLEKKKLSWIINYKNN